MVTVGMDYRVLEGKEQDFISMFDKVVEILEAAPGHVNSRLYRDVKEPAAFLIVSEWDDEEQFQAFVKSGTFAKVTQWGKEQILSARPRHRIFGSSGEQAR